ncbi:MAG: GNAT family N-acetyltransferase [Caulobacteraceae bacterium]|nr:GNAT family N-acetyltransferase [Caulobacteraceae bacterium]
MTNIRVVPATPEALAKIKAWLEVEDTVHRETLDAQEAHWDPKVELPSKGFLCNWNLVEKTFETDPGAVHVLLEGDEPVGFIDGLDIMEVRPDLRGRGYGRRLAEFMLDWATRRGYSVAQIEIAPDDAIPFWRRMGFTIANASRSGPSGGVPAYKILDHGSSSEKDHASLIPWPSIHKLGTMTRRSNPSLSSKAMASDWRTVRFSCLSAPSASGKLTRSLRMSLWRSASMVLSSSKTR